MLKTSGNIVSWFSAGFIAICPLCHWAGIFLAFGQSAFLLSFAKILTPIIIVFILISWLSFYLTFRIHKNSLPLILSLIGGVLVIYALTIAEFGDPIAQLSGILFLSTAALIDFNYRFKKIDCNVCKIRTDLAHEHKNEE